LPDQTCDKICGALMALEHDPENLAVEVDPSVENRFSEKGHAWR
jgi:hypothetical protein